MFQIRLSLCLILFASLAAQLAPAQVVSGTVLGTVTDATGAVVTGAAVTLANEQTNIEFKTRTDDSGNYVIPNLRPGSYTVKVEANGFKPSIAKGVSALSNRTVRADASLETGAVTQAVEVRATAPVVNSESSAISSVMDSRTIVELPLNGRGLDQLVLLGAGVTQLDNANNPRVGGSPYWGGTQFNVDGGSFQDPGNGGSPSALGQGMKIGPSVDSISEFRMDSNTQKAEFDGSVAVTVITKSGTNQLHGSVFEFNQNRVFNSNNPNSPGVTKAPFNRNEFGFSVGGPIIKDRTFFFANYEGLRQRTPTFVRAAVPNQAWRNGNFSGLAPIIDPFTQAPFPNNQIPSNRIDSRAAAILAFVPLPNQEPIGELDYWSGNIANKSNINKYGIRLDHRFGPKDNLTGSYYYSKGDPFFVARAFPEGYGHWSNGGFDQQSWNITHNHTFSTNTLNELRAVYFYYRPRRVGLNLDFDPRKLFPDLYGPMPMGGLPRVAISFLNQIGDYGGDAGLKIYTDQIMDHFTHVHGRHTLKTGIDIGRYRFSGIATAFGLGSGLTGDAAFGSFNFTGRYTSPTATARPPHAFADYLLGFPASTGRASAAPTYLDYFWRYAAYVQDDWQVSRRLTLNFGVRYMVQTPYKERDNTQANLDPVSGKLVFPGRDVPKQALAPLLKAYPFGTSVEAGWGDKVVDTDNNNFAPRLGFAFRPFSNNTTVIRGGAGFYYNQVPFFIGGRQLGFTNPPFLLAESYTADPGPLPTLTLAKPFGGAGTIASNPVITAVDHDLKNSLSQQWNLSVEREVLSNLGVRVSYVGNKTSHLPWYNRLMNEPRVQSGDAIQPRRPYQPWSTINLLATGADSILNQLQVEVSKRYSQGAAFQIEYAWNRSIDNAPIVGGPQDPYNNAGDRGNSEGIQRHIFTLAGSYELPFGPGKRYAKAGGVAGKITGGWMISSITRLRTGSPFSVTFTSSRAGWASGRADRIGDGKLDDPSREKWFDPNAFTVPQPFAYGNAGRNILFAPGRIDIDLALYKNVQITERFRLQLRGEGFNAPNHSNLAAPGANISVPTQVGRVLSVIGGRQFQVGAKLLF
jgi:hypothetical protein